MNPISREQAVFETMRLPSRGIDVLDVWEDSCYLFVSEVFKSG